MPVIRDGIIQTGDPPSVASVGALPAIGYDGQIFVVRDIDQQRVWDIGTASWKDPSTGGGGGSDLRRDEFVATGGQTIFTLSLAPTDADSVQFFVNGTLYDDIVDYTRSGVTITWLDVAFVMNAGDKIHVHYV